MELVITQTNLDGSDGWARCSLDVTGVNYTVQSGTVRILRKHPSTPTSPVSQWHSPSELLDHSGLQQALKATAVNPWWLSSRQPAANNLHTLIYSSWRYCTPTAREDLWLNYTSRDRSLLSILVKACQRRAGLTVHFLVFSCRSVVEILQSNLLKYQHKLAFTKKPKHCTASSLQTWHVPVFSSSLIKNK